MWAGVYFTNLFCWILFGQLLAEVSLIGVFFSPLCCSAVQDLFEELLELGGLPCWFLVTIFIGLCFIDQRWDQNCLFAADLQGCVLCSLFCLKGFWQYDLR